MHNATIFLQIQTTQAGVDLRFEAEDAEPLVISLPLSGAITFWHDWWKALGTHYTNPLANPDAVNATMLSTGDFSAHTSVVSSARVGLWLRPAQCSGISYDFEPDEARSLAIRLLEAADSVQSSFLLN